MKRTHLTALTILTFAMATVMLPACTKKKGCTNIAAINFNADAEQDDGSCIYDPYTKTGELTAGQTWTADHIYYLQGRVVVPSGVTLTIEPGIIIKGNEGQETNASALIVARGGKIMAQGTATDPIIFTSVLDNIELGQKAGTNLTRTDNSGVLQYVSIRHGGITIGEGNELNGLTLGGVGSGTTISDIEIYATLDDGMECFGGTVNVNRIFVYFQGDDGIDLDQNYAGTITNFAVLQGDGVGTDEGLEIDGPEGSTHITGMFHLMNGLCRSVGATDGTPGDFKSKAQGTVENVTFDYASVGDPDIKIRASYANSCVDPHEDAFTHLTGSPATLIFVNDLFTGVNVYTASDDGASQPLNCSVFPADQAAAVEQ